MRFHKWLALFLFVFVPIVLAMNYAAWGAFSLVYVTLALGFIWFSLLLLFRSVMRSQPVYPMQNLPSFSVLVPVYNEKPESLIECVKSIVTADGDKEILLVDDGSTNGIWSVMQQCRKSWPGHVKVHRFDSNMGKREAQSWAIENAKHDILVQADSDVVFQRDALTRLVAPLASDPSVGLTTGNMLIKDEFKSVLNRVQGILWWSANNVGRQSLGVTGDMVCACGTSMAFRKSDFKPFLREYLAQEYLGKPCRFGEDRFMTNIYLREGFKVIYCKDSIGYTDAKETYKAYFKQQLRWRKSMIREGLYAMRTFAWKRSKVMYNYIALNILLPFMYLMVFIAFLIHVVLTQNYALLIYFFGTVVAVTFIRDVYMVFMEPKRLTGIIPFALVNTILVIPAWAIALFTLDDTGWGTR